MTGASPPVIADLSVVVPTVGNDYLQGCLASIAAGSTWPAALIVVDQGTNPAVKEWLDELRDRGLHTVHVASEQRGIAVATNLGFRRAETPIVAVTHDDCRVGRDWAATMAERVRQAGDAIVTGRVKPEGDGLVLTVVTHPDRRVYERPLLDGDVLFPANMGLPVRLLERVGYLDEHPSLLTAGEDNEWAHRVLRTGVPIVYEPDVVVGHLARHTLADLPALYRRYARGQGAFYGTHLLRGDRFIARRVLRDVVRAPWLLLRGVATRNRELIAMGQGEVLGLVPGILAGMRGRGSVRSSST